MAEMIDIYDDNRNKTGLVLPRNTKLVKGQYMLYVLALVENEEGKFLVTRRSLDKKWAAGAWEIPGGGVALGETADKAVCREVLEETGLDISGCTPQLLYSYKNEDLSSGDNYFMDIYKCTVAFKESDVTIQKKEIIDYKLAAFSEFERLHETDGFLHYKRLCEAFAQG